MRGGKAAATAMQTIPEVKLVQLDAGRGFRTKGACPVQSWTFRRKRTPSQQARKTNSWRSTLSYQDLDGASMFRSSIALLEGRGSRKRMMPANGIWLVVERVLD